MNAKNMNNNENLLFRERSSFLWCCDDIGTLNVSAAQNYSYFQ